MYVENKVLSILRKKEPLKNRKQHYIGTTLLFPVELKTKKRDRKWKENEKKYISITTIYIENFMCAIARK